MSLDVDTVVLGAGISGLAAAHATRADGRQVVVLETMDRVGGCFRTVSSGGFRAELGPTTVRVAPAIERLVELGDMPDALETVTADSAGRWLYTHDGLRSIPTGPLTLLKSPLISVEGGMRALAERWIRARDGNSESVLEFFTRRFGAEAGRRIADLAVTGVYAGRPEELVAWLAFPTLVRAEREYGSLLRGLRAAERRRLVVPRDGWQSFAESLAAPLDVRLNSSAEGVERRSERYHLRWGNRHAMSAQRLICTLPAAAAARLLADLSSVETLAGVQSAPVVGLGLGWHQGMELPPGFGLLVDSSLGMTVLGVLFSSHLDPTVAPPGASAITLMMGGRHHLGVVDLSDEAILDQAQRELERVLGALPPLDFVALQRWRSGLPQPTRQLDDARQAANRLEERHPGLSIIGAWRSGPAVANCVAAGLAAGSATT